MSRIHLNCADAVIVHQAVRSKFSIGMHWGTFPLTTEPINQPPAALREEVEKAGLPVGEFITVPHGASIDVAARLAEEEEEEEGEEEEEAAPSMAEP
jgi:L-ascorbate metabolism protein UlaG (beta-lactamase superfamily)